MSEVKRLSPIFQKFLDDYEKEQAATPAAQVPANDNQSPRLPLPEPAGRRGRVVTLSNAINRAAHGLGLPEKRIVFLGLTDLNRGRTSLEEGIHVTRIEAGELVKVFGIDPKNAYSELKAASETLFQREIKFSDGKTKGKFRWVGKVVYHDGEGAASLHWWPDVVAHVSGLTQSFTRYRLKQAADLRSKNSWRLLELLGQFERSGWLEIQLSEFHHVMDATPPQRKNFAHTRQFIIEPAVKELTQKGGWCIEWRAIKTGRKVTALRFDFKRG